MEATTAPGVTTTTPAAASTADNTDPSLTTSVPQTSSAVHGTDSNTDNLGDTTSSPESSILRPVTPEQNDDDNIASATESTAGDIVMTDAVGNSDSAVVMETAEEQPATVSEPHDAAPTSTSNPPVTTPAEIEEVMSSPVITSAEGSTTGYTPSENTMEPGLDTAPATTGDIQDETEQSMRREVKKKESSSVDHTNAPPPPSTPIQDGPTQSIPMETNIDARIDAVTDGIPRTSEYEEISVEHATMGGTGPGTSNFHESGYIEEEIIEDVATPGMEVSARSLGSGVYEEEEVGVYEEEEVIDDSETVEEEVLDDSDGAFEEEIVEVVEDEDELVEEEIVEDEVMGETHPESPVSPMEDISSTEQQIDIPKDITTLEARTTGASSDDEDGVDILSTIAEEPTNATDDSSRVELDEIIAPSKVSTLNKIAEEEMNSSSQLITGTEGLQASQSSLGRASDTGTSVRAGGDSNIVLSKGPITSETVSSTSQGQEDRTPLSIHSKSLASGVISDGGIRVAGTDTGNDTDDDDFYEDARASVFRDSPRSPTFMTPPAGADSLNSAPSENMTRTSASPRNHVQKERWRVDPSEASIPMSTPFMSEQQGSNVVEIGDKNPSTTATDAPLLQEQTIASSPVPEILDPPVYRSQPISNVPRSTIPNSPLKSFVSPVSYPRSPPLLFEDEEPTDEGRERMDENKIQATVERPNEEMQYFNDRSSRSPLAEESLLYQTTPIMNNVDREANYDETNPVENEMEALVDGAEYYEEEYIDEDDHGEVTMEHEEEIIEEEYEEEEVLEDLPHEVEAVTNPTVTPPYPPAEAGRDEDPMKSYSRDNANEFHPTERTMTYRSHSNSDDGSAREPEPDVEFGLDPAAESEKDYKEQRRSLLCLLMICLLLVFLVAICLFIPLWLIDKLKKSPDTSPTIAPVTRSPATISPTIEGTEKLTAMPTALDFVPTSPPSLGDEVVPQYQPLHGPFFGEERTGYGTSIVYQNGLLVVGAPTSGSGRVRAYTVASAGVMMFSEEIEGGEMGSGFGRSIGIMNNTIVVGAPFLDAEESRAEAGGVYLYQLSPSGWTTRGNVVRGAEDIFTVGGEFGYSVAVALLDSGFTRIAVGAPRSSFGDISIGEFTLEAGRVYTFEGPLSSGEWLSLDNEPLNGLFSGARLGTSLAISRDGSFLLAGAPGSDVSQEAGYVYGFRFTSSFESLWQLSFGAQGAHRDEEYGTSVAILDNFGDAIAVGAPGYLGGRGRILVYRMDEGQYTQVGPDIVGDDGDRLGDEGTLGGEAIGGRMSVVSGTLSGIVKRFDYDDVSNTWETKFTPLETGFGGGVTSLSTDGQNLAYIAVGGFIDNAAAVFTAAGDGSSSSPLPPPAPQPASTVSPTFDVSAAPPTPVPVEPTEQPLGQVTDQPSEPPISTTPPPETDQPVLELTESPIGTPTQSPTSSPTGPIPETLPPATETEPPVSKEWIQTGGPFSVNLPSSGFGNVLAFSGDLLVVGAPSALSGTGAALSYSRGTDGVWSETEALYGEESAGFGFALDTTGVLTAIGAPLLLAPGTNVAVGGVYVYEFANGGFTQVGSVLRGSSGVDAANEFFGSSVAVSDNGLVVVGASGNSGDSNPGRGAFYIYSRSGGAWNLEASFAGIQAGDTLAIGVDVDRATGSVVVAGAPGVGPGYAMIFERVGGTWTNTFLAVGDSEGERFGTAVSVLSSAFVAIGAPGFDNNRGRITVFQKVSNSFQRLPDIVGQPLEELGQFGKLSGAGASVLAGTSDGRVLRFDYDQETRTWLQPARIVDTALSTEMQAISAGGSANSLAVGGNLRVSVFSIVE